MAGLVERIRVMLEGDPSVRLVSEDPALTAELLLLFRVMLADGRVHDAEIACFKQICRDAFGLDSENMDGVYRYLEDYSYELTAAQAAEIFRDRPLERRQMLLDHMIEIARADANVDVNEMRVLERISDILGFDIKAD